MLLHLVCVFAIGIPLVLGYLGNRNARENPVTDEKTGNVVARNISEEIVKEPRQGVVLSDEKDGVSIVISEYTVTNVEYSGPSTSSFILTLNNHSYDLSTMDIGGLSHLNDVPASAYELIDNQIGGHHIEARITFPTGGKAVGRGKLHIGLNEELYFDFTL